MGMPVVATKKMDNAVCKRESVHRGNIYLTLKMLGGSRTRRLDDWAIIGEVSRITIKSTRPREKG